jgi:c-di-GMP-binding flagellar brake protein YcgR
VDPEDDEADAVVGLEFQGIGARESDSIRTYVFRLQIALRRKRLVTH